MTRALVSMVLVAALALAPRPAVAQEADLEQIEEARMLYETGTQQYKAGKYAEAEKSFQRVWDVMKMASVLFDIALCQEKQRRWGAAADSFDAFLVGSQRVANRKRLQTRVADLRKRAGRHADLAAMANPPVRSQGKPGAPGNQVLDYKDEELALGSGEQSHPEAVAPMPPPVGQPAAPVSDEGGEKKRSRWWVWAVVGGAVAVGAGVGVGVGLGLQKVDPSPVDISTGPGFNSQGLLEF